MTKYTQLHHFRRLKASIITFKIIKYIEAKLKLKSEQNKKQIMQFMNRNLDLADLTCLNHTLRNIFGNVVDALTHIVSDPFCEAKQYYYGN